MKNNKILILEDKDNKKKLGAIKAVADQLNQTISNGESKWIAKFEKDNFVLEKEFYHEKIIKILNAKFMTNEKLLKKFSDLENIIKNFKTSCNLKIGENFIQTNTFFEFINSVIEIGKKNLSLQRFKGLGEMNPEELWETTLNPDNNSLLKVNYSNNNDHGSEPSESDDEIFFTLMGEDVSKRKNFINSNAINVVNLDI